MINIGIIIGSTRPGRNSEAVAKWVYEIASKRNDEPIPASMHQYTQSHTKRVGRKRKR